MLDTRRAGSRGLLRGAQAARLLEEGDPAAEAGQDGVLGEAEYVHLVSITIISLTIIMNMIGSDYY